MDHTGLVFTALACQAILLFHNACGDPSDVLTNSFTKHLSSVKFSGYTYGIMADDDLVVAEGQGHIRSHAAHARTLLPVLGVSKLFTAVAVMQLIEDGSLHMEDRVFGNHGILYYMRPEHENHMDPRLRDITVRDLLHHTAGWDETKGPIYDPMLNAFYVRNGYNVVDISREMDVYGILSYADIMRFMVTQPLHYSPGTKRVESNFGYSVLGRIIEEVTDLTYEDYVKKNILHPFGMWHTRMGPSYSNTHQAQEENTNEPGRPPKMGYIPLDDSHSKSLFDIVPPIVLDACLGWHSNIYDLSRFFNALFLNMDPDERILEQATVDSLILDPSVTSEDDYDVLDGIGIANSYNGEIWFKSFQRDIGVSVSFYHQPAPFWNDALVDSIGTDVSVILIVVAPEDHPTMIEDLAEWTEIGQLKSLPDLDPIMDEDLANIVINTPSKEYMLLEDLDEHHLMGYMDALRLANFVPIWLQAYNHNDHTRFVVISEQAQKDSDLDFIFLERNERDQLLADIAAEVKDSYQLCFLHSFTSAAHDGSMIHLAMLKGESDKLKVEFDVGSTLESYSEHVENGLRSGYLPMVQSVDVLEGKAYISYILKENPSGQTLMNDSISSLDLDLEELREAMNVNSQRGYILEYLDAFNTHGYIRFSALFRKRQPGENWIMSSNVQAKDLTRDIKKWEELRYIPRIIVGYSTNDGVRFVVVFKTS